jgi:hypothetical protein
MDIHDENKPHLEEIMRKMRDPDTTEDEQIEIPQTYSLRPSCGNRNIQKETLRPLFQLQKEGSQGIISRYFIRSSYKFIKTT